MAALEIATQGVFKRTQWVRCVAHVINLAVQEFLKEIRATVKDFRVYMKSTVQCVLDQSLGEEAAFLKVSIFVNIASTHCSET